ncbi:signal peptidase I [Jeotgalibacillus sp. R-1-5s-1]|uniref:signal peptidase I n=1 Tax=Jeotgalibacillus sp. R-1-5s-1 TaxID=2555897 RepID=UPI00106BE744|nr:signal peptidase I [Jeotgalibacillus sp. R-1-5s-1]TFD94325.1 signal peptidase I [Jeotgalibacillus sp. R-1-5s-1]
MKNICHLVLFMPILLLIACSSDAVSSSSNTIIDEKTPDEVASVEPNEGDFVITFGSDSMDRGDHDYYKENELVVKEGVEIERGKVVYYHTPEIAIEANPNLPEQNVARIVGLPGEEIEIKEGNVYINGAKLEAFYSEALVRGSNEDEYFDSISDENLVNREFFEEYFSMNTKKTKVGENEVYLLVDHWWRGTDSIDFGPIEKDQIIGEILGYSK